MADIWSNAETWDGIATWSTIALTPMFVLLACVLQPDVDVHRVTREQWFYSTSPGPHRILAEWHTVWILVACLVAGVAQFLAWREGGTQWYYPAAMCVFYASVAAQWAWISAYFRLVNKFRTGRACLALALVVNAVLAGLYVPLHKMSSALLLCRILLHDIPMVVIANAAVRIHADPSSPRARGPRPDRPYVRRAADHGKEKRGDSPDAALLDPPCPAAPVDAESLGTRPQRRGNFSSADIVAFMLPTGATNNDNSV